MVCVTVLSHYYPRGMWVRNRENNEVHRILVHPCILLSQQHYFICSAILPPSQQRCVGQRSGERKHNQPPASTPSPIRSVTKVTVHSAYGTFLLGLPEGSDRGSNLLPLSSSGRLPETESDQLRGGRRSHSLWVNIHTPLLEK